MLRTLDLIVTILEPIVLIGFLTVWIYCLVNIIRRKNRFKCVVAGAAGGLSIVLLMTIADILTRYARSDVLRFLDEENGPFTLDVQEQRVAEAQSDSLLNVLRTVRPESFMDVYHSHPTDRVAIRVADHNGRTINLALGRDSGRPREYWVFQTDYATTSNNELGRVATPLLDNLPDAGVPRQP